MRRNKIIMGTGVSLDIPAAQDEQIFERVFDLLEEVDRSYSTYKKDSDISRYRRGEMPITPELEQIKSACERYEKLTDGYFSADYGGEFDPTGYIKGWAINRAGRLIQKMGYNTFCLSIGGDILARSDGAKQWRIGIQDPRDSKKILNKLSIFNGAVATSGSYERGRHIINPKTGQPAAELLSVTVIGPGIIKADALATAVFAMGRQKGEEFMKGQKDYRALIVAGEVVGADVA